MIRRPPRSTRTDTLFPTRRSSDLFLGLARPGFRVVDYLVPFAHPRGRHAIVHVGKLAVVIWLRPDEVDRSEEHTSELQSLMRISYAVFCLKKKKINTSHHV